MKCDIERMIIDTEAKRQSIKLHCLKSRAEILGLSLEMFIGNKQKLESGL